MNVNFPGGAAVVTLRGRLRIDQKRSGPLARGIVVGASVERGQPLSEDGSGAAAHTIALAERLGCSPSDVEKLLTKPVGSRFEAGEEIAKVRKGLRGQSVTAPFAGTLTSYNRQSGIAAFASSDLSDECALVSGIVAAISDDTVSIQFSGSSVFGIAGFGRSGVGPVRFISTDPGHVVTPGEISDSLRGAVVIAGPFVTAPVLKRLQEVRAAAVICGGFEEAELAAAFDVPDDQRMEIWRDAGASLAAPMAVVATEGFGKLPIHPAIWDTLQQYEGRDATVAPRTSLAGQLERPQIIIEDGLADDAPTPVFASGARLRVVDPSSFGQAVDAISDIVQARDDRGRLIDAITVRWPNGRTHTVPITAVELVA